MLLPKSIAALHLLFKVVCISYALGDVAMWCKVQVAEDGPDQIPGQTGLGVGSANEMLPDGDTLT